MENIQKEIENLKTTRGAIFFLDNMQDVFPKRDFYLCTEIDKFNFVLKVNKDDNGVNYIEKINV